MSIQSSDTMKGVMERCALPENELQLETNPDRYPKLQPIDRMTYREIAEIIERLESNQ